MRGRYFVTVDDLLGLIELGGRIGRRLERRVFFDPGAEETRSQWTVFAQRLVVKLQTIPVAERPVPACHALGTAPVGYDWSGSQCDGCAVKLSCQRADPTIKVTQWIIRPPVAVEAIQRFVAETVEVGRGVTFRKPAPALSALNPEANVSRLWASYPAGFLIPKVFGTPPVLYELELDRLEGPLWGVAVWRVLAAWDAEEAVRLLGLPSDGPRGALEQVLESDFSVWDRVRTVRPVASSAVNAAGTNEHVHAHVVLDQRIMAGKCKYHRCSSPAGLFFWHLVPESQRVQPRTPWRRHAEARRLRALGVERVRDERPYHGCGACARAGSPTALRRIARRRRITGDGEGALAPAGHRRAPGASSGDRGGGRQSGG